jgi:HlyD family secretion protein
MSFVLKASSRSPATQWGMTNLTSRKRRVLAGAGLAVLIAGAVAFGTRGGSRAAEYRTAVVDRGDVKTVVGATGSLEAVTTVQVGSQVSGTVVSLGADFNDRVRKGQVLARLDPSALDARLQQARANLVAAQAAVERTRAEAGDSSRKLARARELSAEGLLPPNDLETAATTQATATAQVRSAQAAVAQAAAAVRQAEVDVERAVITSPIDGVVVARQVDIGQTVAASLQAPTLFVIAQDLARMQVVASIDEADVGRVSERQPVTFTVDAWPGQEFQGRVREVRLQPTVTQNVVTYATIIDAENPDLKLKPGMTATVSIVAESREDVVRVPAGALSFRPEGFDPQSFGAQRRAQGEARGDGTARADSTPERRAPGTGRGERPAAGGAAGRPQLVFRLVDGKPEPARVRTGVSDGRHVEVLEGLKDGETVIVGTESDSAAKGGGTRTGGTSPFSPQRPSRPQR